jgi:hypothetical protein
MSGSNFAIIRDIFGDNRGWDRLCTARPRTMATTSKIIPLVMSAPQTPIRLLDERRFNRSIRHATRSFELKSSGE